MAKPITNLTGSSFGELTVISFHGFLHPDNKKDRKPAWLCRCSCGKEFVIRAAALNCKNHTSSCFECARAANGLKYNNLIGKRFGRLLVESKAERPDVSNGSQYWNVVCDCGTRKIVSTSTLNRSAVSCGCYNKENASKVHTTHGLSGDHSEYNKMRRSDPVENLKHKVGVSVRKQLLSVGKKKSGSVWSVLPYNPTELKNILSHCGSLG